MLEQLYRVAFGGTAWRVVLADESEYPDIAGCEGKTDGDAALIVIHRSVAPERRPVVLVHELLHASLWTPGSHALLGASLGLSAARLEEIEEAFVTISAPMLADALCGIGFLPEVL